MNPIVLSDLQLLLNLGLAFYFINPETPICELDHIHRLFHETPQTPRLRAANTPTHSLSVECTTIKFKVLFDILIQDS